MSKEIEQEIDSEVADSLVIAPLLDGLKKVAKRATETEVSTKAAIVEIKTETKASIGAVKEQIEKGLGDVLDRIDTLSKRTSVFGRMNIEQDDASAIKSVVPDRFLKNLGQYEIISPDGKGLYGDPRYIAAKHAWFNLSSKLQLRTYDSEREANRRDLDALSQGFDKINKGDWSGGTNTAGGHSVPDIVAGEILKIVRDASLIYTRARQIPMTSDTLNFPDETTAVTTNWVLEAGALTAGEPVMGLKQLLAKKLVGRATFSLELLDDANVAILPFLQSCFAERMGGELDAQAMEGSGSPFTGVMFATSVNDAGATNSVTGVKLTYMPATAATGTWASMVRIYTKSGQGNQRNDGIFVCGPGVYTQIIGLVDTNGQPVVRLGTVEGQPNNTLFGRPIVVSSMLVPYTIGAGTASVGSLYYGPPSALLFGLRKGITWDVSEQVNWAKYQADARMVGRFGYVVGVPAAWTKQINIIV